MIASHDLRAHLLKVGHHGSNSSSTQEWIDAVRPRWAVISVGARNTFGHPRIEVLRRFGAAKLATYRTDLSGAVTFYLDGRSVSPQLACLR
jgi:competence protein ComEC